MNDITTGGTFVLHPDGRRERIGFTRDSDAGPRTADGQPIRDGVEPEARQTIEPQARQTIEPEARGAAQQEAPGPLEALPKSLVKPTKKGA